MAQTDYERHHARHTPATDPRYRQDYERGWRYSAREGASLDSLDGKRASDAEYDGYMDYATGRSKWALWHCRTNGGCREHDGFPAS